uniref:Uncharacterized protein n=1 Tax=Arundo donax TaxID=35708 RepID=A0A0A9GIW1_ARUDO
MGAAIHVRAKGIKKAISSKVMILMKTQMGETREPLKYTERSRLQSPENPSICQFLVMSFEDEETNSEILHLHFLLALPLGFCLVAAALALVIRRLILWHVTEP